MTLRQFRTSDVAAITEIFADPDVMQFGTGSQTAKWTQSWIERTIDSYIQGYGLWAVILHESDQPIGYCGITQFEDINGQPEIELGYRLAKKHWGRGLATEVATAVRDLAFTQLKLQRLISLIDPDNHRSIRVAEKLGMRHTDNATLSGYDHPDRIYSCEQNVQ